MPHANVTELRYCLKDCISYCEEHEEKEYCEVHLPRLVETLDNLENAIAKTDQKWIKYKSEYGEGKIAWKQLAKTVREAQRELASVDAIGYPDREPQYWIEEELVALVEALQDYLEERKDAIDFADRYLTKLETQLDASDSEETQQVDARRVYSRFVGARKDAIADCGHVIGGFRESIRRDLGKDHPDYESIRWAQSVAPDKSVL